MSQPYSQVRAMLAITTASLRALAKSPQSVFFGLFFPIVLIVIFGSLGGRGGGSSVRVAFEKGTDTTSDVYRMLSHTQGLRILPNNDSHRDPEELLQKGRLAAILGIQPAAGSGNTQYVINMRTSRASLSDLQLLYPILRNGIHDIEERLFPNRPRFAVIRQELMPGREYKSIDFLLPGMIGFSLVGSAVFTVAFLFFSLRETLVLKRLYATPVRRSYIILGESLARVIFQLLVVALLLVFGRFAYGFTLAHGPLTFLSILVLSLLALLVFMGFGFFISSIAKNQNVIPIYANLFIFPQYFLSGTFFPKEALPEFLQGIVRFLPLTAYNDALRRVSFEGAGLGACWPEIAILAAWGLAIYAATVRVFRWE
ncbi:ABC transporter permease [Flaviaesturariibacter flavus]|uniref:Transport permease protein n=1 Tax=Flaviaesturariibacter flavus TaxID=2502780 RepID=A0A4R1B8I3_9BACT|nr:ABC transporter permease [Flaviaesturariibacter flavus]TCJ12453.1 ABC transporter permease [Flaviaesturariibacter flavus]